MDTTRSRGSHDASRTRPDEVEPDGEEPDGKEKTNPDGRSDRGAEGSPEEEGGGQNGSEPKTVTDPEAQKDPWEKARQAYDEEGRGEGREAAAQRLSEEHFFAAPGGGGDLYVYDEESAVFKPNGRRVIEETIRTELGPRHSTTEVRQIAAKIRADSPGELLGAAEVIPLANGDLPASQLKPNGPLELRKPSPERPFLRRSEARGTPTAECPTLNRILQQAVSSRDERHTLQEYAGYCLFHWGRPFQTALLLVGPGREAKRAYLRALNAVVPWVSSVAPRRLAKSRSKGSQLHGPWVNIGTGISPGVLLKTEFFHEFGPGSPARSDSSQLGGREEQPVPRRPAKHVYATETLPEVFPGKRVFRRIELVSFSGDWSPEEPWPKLERDLAAERDGILRWAIGGLRRLLREEGFSLRRPSEETQKVWEAHGDPISRFKAEQLEVTGDLQRHFEPKGNTYEAYRRFCQAEGTRPIEKKRTLTRRLKEDPRISDGKRTPEGHGDQKRCYEGILLRN